MAAHCNEQVRAKLARFECQRRLMNANHDQDVETPSRLATQPNHQATIEVVENLEGSVSSTLSEIKNDFSSRLDELETNTSN